MKLDWSRVDKVNRLRAVVFTKSAASRDKPFIYQKKRYLCDEMAKKFACKDIGLSCGFEARADSEDELMGKIAEHARKAHNMQSIDAATMSKVKAAIKEA